MPHQNGKSITKTKRRVLKTVLITKNSCDMKKTKKTVIHIFRLRTGQYLFLFHTCWLLFKNVTDLQKVVEIKVGFALAKTQNVKHLKFKYQQRSVKLKFLLLKWKKGLFLQFSATLPNKIYLFENIFTNLE